MRNKPKHFHLIYESGVRAEFCDPITGLAWYRMSFPAIKRSMAELARTAGEHLTLINDDNGHFITVEPDGTWR